MIAWLSKEKKQKTSKIDYNNLKHIIKKLKNRNEFNEYLINLFNEYDMFLYDNYLKSNPVINNLKLRLKKDLIDCSKNIELIKKCNLVLSSSHENTYYILKELNKNKDNKVMVICLDMHSDTYDYSDLLWKGNVFSKLLKEEYIDSLLVLGVPRDKIEQTKLDIQNDIKDKVYITDIFNIEKCFVKNRPTIVFISIDIDCLNTRESKLTALEYCPATILNNISHLSIQKHNEKELEKKIKDCIFVKNDLGYANLYRVGENNIDFIQLKFIIENIKQLCIKNGINLGFNYNNHIIGDITEINGYDYGGLTSEIIIKLINELI